MPHPDTIVFDLPDPAATRAFGDRLAPELRAGDLVTLSGPIGAGKTELARAIIRARAGAMIEVPSPSFTLIQTYDLSDISIAHVDLYRLGDPSELVELGLEDLSADHLLIVEWPDRAPEFMAAPDLALRLDTLGEGRRLHVAGDTARLSPMSAFHA